MTAKKAATPKPAKVKADPKTPVAPTPAANLGDVELPPEKPVNPNPPAAETNPKPKKVTDASILADLKAQRDRLKELISRDSTRGRRASLKSLEDSIADLEP